MLVAALTFSGTAWLLPAALALVAAVALLVWSYRAAPSGPLRWACVVLKILGLAALALCLLEPLWTGQRARPGANIFAIVADNSQSLAVKDRGETKSRGDDLRALASAPWTEALGDTFEVRRYTFDARLQNATDFHELTFDGRASALGSSLKTLAERFRGRPLAGVILLTDGNATDLTAAPANLAGLPPIYPVVVGRSETARDLSVQQVRVSQSAFEDAPVSIQADIAASGFSGEPVQLRVADQAGKIVQEQSIDARHDDETLAFHLNLKPEKPGVSFYKLSVGPRGEVAPGRAEATLANNQRVLVVDRGQGPYRILYVSGRLNWEFKFLNRAVQEDDQLALVGLIREAKREPKFDFRGRGGETSNPLYRGFGNQSPEEVERYDQPVMSRVNTRDEFELRGGFPRTAEELYAYHAVIVDDLEAAFFTPEQASLLQKFVSERGGGFLMLGGMETFREGGYARTPVGDLLPVYLDRGYANADAPEGAEEGPPAPLHYELAREGWLQPWARLRDNEAAEKERIGAMPPFQIINRVGGPKPGASVIATVREEGRGELPALVIQRFGRGRSAALTLGDVWRWGMADAEKHADMDKSWRQLMRWLVADVPNRVDCAVEPLAGDPNGAMTINVRARDEKYLPLDDAKVTLEIAPVLSDAPGGALKLTAEPSASEPGLYTATYIPRATGGYRATAVVASQTGAEVGRAEAGWSTDLAADEFRSLSPNVALLESIAKQTKGEVIAASQLDAFVRTLPNRQAPMMETWTQPAWHTPVLFGFALACLLAEWALRRWNGLP